MQQFHRKRLVTDRRAPDQSHACIRENPADLIFVLGYAENPKEEKWEKPGIINKTPARELLARFRTDAQVDTAFAEAE